MTSTPEVNDFNIDEDEDEPSQAVTLENEPTQDVNHEDGDSAQQQTPRTGLEIEVDKIPQEMKIRILKRYTNLSHNDIFRRTGTAPRTGRRMLSVLPPRKPGPGRTGRPTRLRQDLIQKMIEEVSNPNSERAIDWQKLGNEHGQDVHKHTIRRAMEKAGYKKCLGCQKGYLTAENRAQRLQFAKDYLSCPRWQWEEVLYGVEMHFTYNKRKRGVTEWSICEDKERHCIECIQQKHRSGKAEFHVWSCVSWNYKGPLVFHERPVGEGGFSEEFYRDGILRAHVEPRHRVFRANGKGFVLLEENDGLHRTRTFGDPAWKYKDEIGLHYYTNPPNSFDFNPNVALWRLIEQRTKLPKEATKVELQWELQVEWDKITIEEINKEISSLQGRMHKCVEHGGLLTYT